MRAPHSRRARLWAINFLHILPACALILPQLAGTFQTVQAMDWFTEDLAENPPVTPAPEWGANLTAPPGEPSPTPSLSATVPSSPTGTATALPSTATSTQPPTLPTAPEPATPTPTTGKAV